MHGERPTNKTLTLKQSYATFCPGSTPIPFGSWRAIEGWSRDATWDVADAVVQRAADTDAEISSALHAFIEANATKRFDLQLTLPLRGAA